MARSCLLPFLLSHVKSLLQQLPRENVESLTLKAFHEKYVNTFQPVILQYSNAQKNWRALREWDQKYLLANCPDAHIKAHKFGNSLAWAGIDLSSIVDMSFRDLFESWANVTNSSDTRFYGFEFNIKCHCPELLFDFELLKYFLENPLLHTPEDPYRYRWPSLIMGPTGTQSGLHVDNGFLPSWLTLLQGRKQFRVITYESWRRHLTKFIDVHGNMLQEVRIFDDSFLATADEFADVIVWTGDLAPGETIYVPVGAAHAGLNLEAQKGLNPTIAVASNFVDATHEKHVRKTCRASQKLHPCLQLKGVVDGPFNSHRRRQKPVANVTTDTADFVKTFMSADFCSTLDARMCSKLKSFCMAHGFSWKRLVGPCLGIDDLGTLRGFSDLAELDINGDGSISLTEFQTLSVMNYPEPSGFSELKSFIQHEIPNFKQIDKNSDGELSCVELGGNGRNFEL